MIITSSNFPEDWKGWRTDLAQLDNARCALAGESSFHQESRAEISRQFDKCLAYGLDHGLPSGAAASLFSSLPAGQTELALTGAGSTAIARLLELGSPGFSEFTRLPSHTRALSETALRRYIELGLPYAELLSPAEAAEAWLSRGAPFGEAAWRRDHPRKSPVLFWWEENGLILPRHGLCPEGILLVAQEIRGMKNRSTAALERKTSDLNQKVDWRVSLAFYLAEAEPPGLVRSAHVHERTFGEELAAKVHSVFYPGKGAHAQLQSHRRRASAPSIETILAMTSARPKCLDDILPISSQEPVAA